MLDYAVCMVQFDQNHLLSQLAQGTLTNEQIEHIHLASLKILERTGIAVEHDGARELLRTHGCTVSGDDRVRIPPGLVKQALASAPDRVLLYDRNDDPAVDLGADRSYFGTGSIIFDGFRRAGLERASLEVTAENDDAIRLYRRYGFEIVKTVYKAVEMVCI